jgi:hypothetical protein
MKAGTYLSDQVSGVAEATLAIGERQLGQIVSAAHVALQAIYG